MKRRLAVVGSGLAVVLASTGAAVAGPSNAGVTHRNVRVCLAPTTGFASCHAVLHQAVTADGQPAPNATSPSSSAKTPEGIKLAYGFDGSSTAGAGKTIAIVDAYDAPNIKSDLDVFSSYFQLPLLPTCSSIGQSSCFQKVNQTGGTSYPRADSGWALEIALDVEWAHAIAPGAKILLVEASSNSFTNLLTAEDYAKTHAEYVSNSWGASEFNGESSYDSHFSQSGVSFFVSSGDNGTPAEYPSSSPNVVSVGGTTLTGTASPWTETAWSSGGGGCSAYEQGTSTQVNATTSLCGTKRATPDVSLDADPNTGVAVYDSTTYNNQSGWFTVGGTSASSPMVAARAATLGVQVTPAYLYGTLYPSNVYDVDNGNNGAAAGTGYDLATGIGSWDATTGNRVAMPSSGGGTLDAAGGGGGGGGGGGSTGGPHLVHLISATISPSARGKGIDDKVVVGDANGIAGINISISITGNGSTASGSATTGGGGAVTFRYSKGVCGPMYTTTLSTVSGTDGSGNPYTLDTSYRNSFDDNC